MSNRTALALAGDVPTVIGVIHFRYEWISRKSPFSLGSR
jgi:hypothetical protein